MSERTARSDLPSHTILHPASPHQPSVEAICSVRLEGPRERLAGSGVSALSEAELLALVMRTGTQGRSAQQLAHDLLLACGGLRRLRQLSARALERAPGVGPAKAASLVAAFELARRTETEPLVPGRPIRSPEAVDRHFRARLCDDRQEAFRILLLDGRHHFLGEFLITRGTLTASLVHPREVFRPALLEAAAAMVLVHNHPSGDPSPSAEDREVTRRLVRSGELLGVRVVDHVIVADRGFFSFREAGEFDSQGGPE